MAGRAYFDNRGTMWSSITQINKSMKLTSILTVVLTCLALASSALAADKKYKEGGCCDKAAKKGEKCGHPCCVAAEKEGKACEKCNK